MPPLPEGGRNENVPWPPLVNRPALDEINTWATWYGGNPDRLSVEYAKLDARMTQTQRHVRPSQLDGGVVGWIARSFWGTPPSLGEPRAKLHMPLAADIATVSSDLLFSEPITVKHEQTATMEKLVELLDDTLQASLLESAEVCSGLGGVYLRAVWDRDKFPNGPWFSAIHADAGVPEWTYGRMSAVTLWRTLLQQDNRVIRWLERHEPGSITHGVYEGTPDKLGRILPLTEMPETAGLADVVQDGNRIDTGTRLLTAVYVPNMRPNRLWHDQPANCHLGRSDYASVEPTFDALDEVYSSWMRDLRLAKARLVVPGPYLESKGPGKGAAWDPEREIYEALNMLPGKESGSQITLAQFAIRVEEHERTAQHLVKKAVGTAGYSGVSFGLDDDATAAITATEVAARKDRSLSTRDKKIKYWRPGIRSILAVLADIGHVSFGWNTSGEKPPEVIFPEAVQPDPEAVARTLQLLDAARSISIETKVIKANPERADDKPWVDAEVQRIKDENQIGVQFSNPDTFGASNAAGGAPQDKAVGKPPAGQKAGE